MKAGKLMVDPFQELRDAIDVYLMEGTLPSSFNPSSFSNHIYSRLARALMGEKGVWDLIALIRCALRRETELQRGQPQYISVPCKDGWPEPEQWALAGVKVMNRGENRILIRAEPWIPSWVEDGSEIFPEKDAFAESIRINYGEVAGDPFLGALGRRNYRSATQRDALRSVLTAPPRSTLVLNLPTGSGKSLCFQIPALLKTHLEGVTVVVVPTTSLALDQERAVEKYLDGEPAAYYSDPSGGQQEINALIRKKLRNGTQRLLFTSPESLSGALLSSLYEVTRRGSLKMLVIDEAHMVDQWGDEFRPAFQELSGIRTDLLKVCPEGNSFNTVLLSATVTEPCLDTLETLFGKPGPFEVLSAVQIRPEPSYWVFQCESEEDKEKRVIEAINHLPRPLILYVTKVKDAEKWYEFLQNYGYQRCNYMTGNSKSDDRRQVIKNWQECKIDLIVATSAFGLGIDQADVRTVIHACVPENVDRFYQEVGRGGRDGRASVSMLFYTLNDIKVSYSLGKKIITVEKGLKRWERMFRAAENLEGSRLRVPVTESPGINRGELDMDGSYNEAWNIRTLTLLARASLIELDSNLPPRPELDEEGEVDQWEVYLGILDEYRKHRVIKVLDHEHLEPAMWENRVEKVRQSNYFSRYRGMDLMEEALRGNRCFSDIFSEAYTIAKRLAPNRRGCTVVTACGGCPACRRNGLRPFANPFPRLPLPDWEPFSQLGEGIKKIMGENPFLAVFFEREDLLPKVGRDLLQKIVRWLVMQGFINLVVEEPALWERVEQALKNSTGSYVFHFSRYRPLEMLPVPTVVFIGEKQQVDPALLNKIKGGKIDYPLILLLSKSVPDPTRNGVPLENTLHSYKMDFNELVSEVDS